MFCGKVDDVILFQVVQFEGYVDIFNISVFGAIPDMVEEFEFAFDGNAFLVFMELMIAVLFCAAFLISVHKQICVFCGKKDICVLVYKHGGKIRHRAVFLYAFLEILNALING